METTSVSAVIAQTSMFGDLNIGTIIVSLISGALGSLFGFFASLTVLGVNLGWKNVERRTKKAERVMSLLGEFEILRLDAYFIYLENHGKDTDNKEAWSKYEDNLNKAGISQRKAEAIIKFWMPQDIFQQWTSLMKDIHNLLNEGTREWARKNPPQSFKDLDSSNQYQKRYDTFILRMKDWANTHK